MNVYLVFFGEPSIFSHKFQPYGSCLYLSVLYSLYNFSLSVYLEMSLYPIQQKLFFWHSLLSFYCEYCMVFFGEDASAFYFLFYRRKKINPIQQRKNFLTAQTTINGGSSHLPFYFERISIKQISWRSSSQHKYMFTIPLLANFCNLRNLSKHLRGDIQNKSGIFWEFFPNVGQEWADNH